MHISFSAPLRSHTRINAPVVYSELDKHETEKTVLESGEDYVEMVFSAYVSQLDYKELQDNNIRVEMWTEIPKLNDRNANPGDWGPVVFKDIQRESIQRPDGDFVSNDIEQLTLLVSSDLKEADLHGEDKVSSKESEVKELRASLLIPTTRQRTFGFTYRLVYAAGWIRWLGRYDSNGYVDVVIDTEQASFVEHPGWRYSTSGVRSFFAKEADSSSRQICLGYLNNVNYLASFASGIAISSEEKNDTYIDKGIGHSYLLLVVPPLALQSNITQKPLIFYTLSKGSSITIEPEGVIKLQSVGTEVVTERMMYDGNRDLLEQVLQRLGYDVVFESTDVLIIAKKDPGSITYRASTLFFSPSMPLGGWRLQLCRNRLRSLFPDSTCICFFSINTSKSIFYDLTNTIPAHLRLLIGKDGGDLIISPVFNLGEEKSIQIAFASPLCSSPRNSKSYNNLVTLPTPPASPQPYRRKQIKPNEKEDTSPDTFSSIDDVTMTSLEVTDGVVDAEQRKESEGIENIIQAAAQPKQPSASLFRETIAFIFIFLQAFVLRRLWDIIFSFTYPTWILSDTAQDRAKNLFANTEQDRAARPSQEQLSETIRETAVERSSIQQSFVGTTIMQERKNINIEWLQATPNFTDNHIDSGEELNLPLSASENNVIIQKVVFRSGTHDEYILEWEKGSQSRQDFIVKHLGPESVEISCYMNVFGKKVETDLKMTAVIDELTTLYSIE